MPTFALIVGLWTTTCIQTQIANNNQGWVIESYAIRENSQYEFTRTWHRDPQCSEVIGEDVEAGHVSLGRPLNGFFVTSKTYEADFKTDTGMDLGAVAISEDRSLKIGRGMPGSTFRNTMVGLFEYKKQK